MISDFNTSYYVSDFNGHIFLLNENYGYVTNKTFILPAYMVTVNSSLFITGGSNIWKTDKNLNILKTHNESGNYRGIYFNLTENIIYVAPIAYTYLQFFDSNLNFKYNVSVSPNYPYSLSEFNNELYVGTTQGSILVIVSQTFIRKFTVFSGLVVTSVILDNVGFIAVLCNYNSLSTGKSLTTPINTMYAGIDSKGRYVLMSRYQISIYYYRRHTIKVLLRNNKP
jgi:hypothetical protein